MSLDTENPQEAILGDDLEMSEVLEESGCIEGGESMEWMNDSQWEDVEAEEDELMCKG